MPSTPGSVVEVVVGMPTYRRPAGLARALPALVAQSRALTNASGRVVIVDNDPDGGAFEQVRPWLASDVFYVHEPRPGIAAARNRALAMAQEADALVCVDDDEEPREGWLQNLVDSWLSWGCAAVTGPVESVFEGSVDAWVLASGMFETRNRAAGVEVVGADSGNLLLDLGVLRHHGIVFDEEFGLSGGSDTMLAHTLRSRGEVIRWCQEALVAEHVPPARTQRSWVVSRTIRTSNTWSRMRLNLAAQAGTRSLTTTRGELIVRGLVRLIRGMSSRAVAVVTRNERLHARAVVDMASGRGLLMGALGVVSFEYARPVPGRQP